jgi:hypothetical protein
MVWQIPILMLPTLDNTTDIYVIVGCGVDNKYMNYYALIVVIVQVNEPIIDIYTFYFIVNLDNYLLRVSFDKRNADEHW